MSILYILITGLCLLIAFFLVFPFLMVLVSRVFSEKIKVINPQHPKYKNFDYACIITAYKNVEISKPLVQSLLRQYHSKLHIYLIADESDVSQWDIKDERLMLLRPDPPLRLKAKSIIHAVDHFVRDHDFIAIFDADNLAHPDFLSEINQYANNGWKVIQGQRTAKNLDTIYACADATGEFYKNYTDRYIPYLLGSSAVISGSGMAVTADLYKAYLESPEIAQGQHQWKKMLQEDKILQNNLLFKKERIAFAKRAIVYDEKVVSGDQVETQRSRWLFSYFQNLPNSSGLLLKGIFGLNWNQFLFGLVTISPPMFIQLFLGIVLTLLCFFVDINLSLLMVFAILIFGLNIFWILYLSKVPTPIWKAIWGLPLFAGKQFKGLFKIGNPNKNFKHSEHSRKVSIDDVLKSGETKTDKKG